MKSKKIKFQFQGEVFELPAVAVRKDSYNNDETYIHMGAKHTASVIKQYVKKMFPQIKVWASSDVYSGGSSTRVDICNPDGSPVDREIEKNIESFAQNFKAGRFDGMYDIYEYREDKISTDNGTKFKYFPSYVFVTNRAPFGTLEYYINEFNEFGGEKYDHLRDKLVGSTLLEQFLNWNREYFKKGFEEKLVTVINK